MYGTQSGTVSRERKTEASEKKKRRINDENPNTVETNVDESGVLSTHPDNG
jgi:hypothetical protein